ncbi:MAG: hypothetical protein DI586_09595 [Micavibrio aeruginosavorus]|uniref:Uncharacterized protein n=1 Tax=Micavibrio aeruginosavorus TaxID=349221 RepID=A0A2W5FL80_9BACT|nr:MAG: hypothetical protein DI586_09595 [Micavibrio aeruginosavorus]
MKYFILLCLLFISPSAFATPITPEQGQVFYKSCVSQPDPRMLPGSQDVFCRCTTQRLVQNMTFEDAQAYVKQDRAAVNKYLITAYAPCMEVPVHDDVMTACQKQNVSASQCSCLANGIGKYTAKEAQRLLGSVLAKYPNAFDPIAAIKQTPEFESELEDIARQCGRN